jgi:hypothetical protein
MVGLDASWAHALSMAHSQGLSFGRDLVFTFGPLGYMFYPVPGDVSAVSAFSYVWLVYAGFLASLLVIWRALGTRLPVLVSWIALSFAMLLSQLPFERMQVCFLGVVVAAIVSEQTKAGRFPTGAAVAGTVSGVMLLFKTNEGIAAVATFYALLLWFVVERRGEWRAVRNRLALLAGCPLLSFLIGYVCVEHNITSLWAYVTGSLRIALGYSEAMSYPGPTQEAALAAVSLFTLLLIIPAATLVRGPALWLLPTCAMAGFFAFKSGVVRQDESHSALLHFKFAVTALLLLVVVKRWPQQLLLSLYVGVSLAYGTFSYKQAAPMQWQIAKSRLTLAGSVPGTIWDGPVGNFRKHWELAVTWDRFRKYVSDQLRPLKVDPDTARIVATGTVDVVPSELDIIPANNWSWKPRPVIQSYSAYAPALDLLNAQHLASTTSAEYVLMHWTDIDGRHPLLDDGASWRALFDHYDIVRSLPEFLVLRRRASPRFRGPNALCSQAATWNSDIQLPFTGSKDYVVMRADIQKSAWGVARGFLFRNSPVFLVATYGSGQQVRWRVTRGNLVDGAFIGVLPQNLEDSKFYFGDTEARPDQRVRSIRFETPGLIEFSSAIQISWSTTALRDEAGHGDRGPAVHRAETSAARPTDLKAVPLWFSRPLNKDTDGYVDYVDGRSFTGQTEADVAAGVVELSGWAVDGPSHSAASSVFIDVDGSLYPAKYGLPRPDVAAGLGNTALGGSGFSARFVLKPGSHRVRVRIGNAARTGFYNGPWFTLTDRGSRCEGGSGCHCLAAAPAVGALWSERPQWVGTRSTVGRELPAFEVEAVYCERPARMVRIGSSSWLAKVPVMMPAQPALGI